MALRLLGATAVRIIEAKEQSAPIPKDNVPTCPIALATATLFKRKPDQEWSEVEISIFKKARKRGVLTLESMTQIDRYYAAERRKGDDGMHRRDLLTFLRNCDGEADRARAHAGRKNSVGPGWAATQPPLLVPLPALTAEEIEEGRKFEERRKGLA